MSKKITESMLKGLIEEVLNEELLNEFKVDLGNGEEQFNSFTTSNKKKISIPAKNKDDLKNLAKQSGDPDKLDLTDIGNASGEELKTAQHIAANPGSLVNKSDVQAALSGGGGGIPGVKDPSALRKTGAGLMNATDVKKELKKITAAFIASGANPTDAQLAPIKVTAEKYQTAIAAQAGKTQGSVQKAFDQIAKDLGLIIAASAGSIKDAIKNLNQTIADVEEIFGTPVDDTDTFSSPKVDLPYHAISDDSWSRGKDIKANNLPNTTVQIILTELSRFNMDFTEMLEYYEQLGASLINARTGDTAGMAAIKAIPAEKLFTSISVMATLDYITNSFQGSSAGPIYEVLQALLAGGVVFGGKGAGADVLMGKKGELWLSNKNSQLGSGNVAASGTQAKKNIYDIKVGQTMWYIGFGKAGTNTSKTKNKGRNTKLRIFIVGINRTNSADADTSFSAINADGTVLEKSLETSSGKYVIPFKLVKSDTIDIPIRPLPDVDFSQLASDAIDAAKDATQIAIRDIYVKLENIEKRTQTFLALHARQGAKASDKSNALDAAGLAAADYTSLKGDLKSGFSGVDAAAGAKFNESKKVTSGMLKKLIQEKFKK